MVKRRGVTLMELMMVVSIIGILFAIGAPLMLQANRQFIMVKTKLELQREARSLMYTITRSLRQARSATITISRANTSQPFYSKIVFTKETSTFTYVSQTLTFQQEGNTLYQVLGGVKRPLSKNLSYLAFTFPRSDDMSMISISLTLQKNIYEGKTKALHMASEKVHVMNTE